MFSLMVQMWKMHRATFSSGNGNLYKVTELTDANIQNQVYFEHHYLKAMVPHLVKWLLPQNHELDLSWLMHQMHIVISVGNMSHYNSCDMSDNIVISITKEPLDGLFSYLHNH